MRALLLLLRVKDYLKNITVFFPVFFAGSMGQPSAVLSAAGAFWVFCLASSGVYVMNDLFDRHRDAAHPLKQFRPIAAGQVTTEKALWVLAALYALAAVTAWWVSPYLLLIVGLYVSVQVFYSWVGRAVPVLDILLITLGFILRLQAGGDVTGIPITAWLYAMVALGAIGFGLAKRLEEAQLLSRGNVPLQARPALRFYTIGFTRTAMLALVGVTLVCYFFYTISPHTTGRLHSNMVFVTVAPAAVGAARYIWLIFKQAGSCAPQEVILTDRITQACVLVWLLMMAYFIY